MKYLLGSPEQFHNFVNSISPNDKVGIVTHTDLDGIASGIFLQKILESKNLNLSFIEFVDYGADALKYIPNKDYDKLFFTDWNVDEFPEDLDRIREKGDVLVLDHHPMNENLANKNGIIKTESKYCSSHALFDLGKKYYNAKNLEWLVCSAILLDYTFTEDEVMNFVQSIYPEINKDNLWDSDMGKIARKIANSLTYYKKDLRRVYELVLEEDFDSFEKADRVIGDEIKRWVVKYKDEAEYYPKKNLYYLYATPDYSITSAVVSIISNKELPNDTLIFISDDLMNEGFVKMSARNQTEKIQLGKILKKCVEDFEDSNAGGHDKAAAGGFPKKYLNLFKERLLEEL